MEKIAKQVVFKGRVQGVGFRYTAHRIGRQYDLSGYVRNLSNGSVQAFLQGTKANIQACIDEIQDAFNGYIRETKSTDQPINPHYYDFRITY